MQSRRTVFHLVIVQLFVVSAALAQDDIETDRPDQTETAATVAPGHVQIEAGFVYEHDVAGGFSTILLDTLDLTSLSMPTVLVRVGIVEGFELRFEGGIERHRAVWTSPLDQGDTTTTTEASSPAIGIKAELMKEDGVLPQTALIFDLTIPIGEDRSVPGYVAPGFRFSMSHTLSDAFALGYNLGGEWDGYSARGTGIYTLTVAAAVTDNIGAYVELFGEVASGDIPSHNLDAGATFRPQPNLQFDVSAGIGITEPAPDYYLAAGVSMRLPD